MCVDRRVRRWTLPVTVSDELANTGNTPHRRLFVASPTLPTLESPRRCSASPTWCRLPFAVCSCDRRAGTLDASVATGRCCPAACSSTTSVGEGRRQFELDRLSPSVCGPPAQCRRLSADDMSELSGGVLVDTSTLKDPQRRRTVDKPIYLPLGQNQRCAPSSDHDGHYFRYSIDGQDHVFNSDGRLHDNPDLLFAS